MTAAPHRRIPFRMRLRVPVGDVTERHGWLLEGPAGWSELSPLPGWGASERASAARAADEMRTSEFPLALRSRVTVNAMVPRLPPAEAAALAAGSGCGTIKVKVGDPASEDRVRAVREATAPGTRIRLDANGSWDLDGAQRMMRRLARWGIELVEDPVASLHDLARLRRLSPIPVAAEMSIRGIEHAVTLRRLGAADAVVLKPQRLGGVRMALRVAEAAGVPAVASSALESSVGLAAVVALAACLPDTPYAHGAGTALLLEGDVTADRLVPVGGVLALRRVQPSPELLTRAAGARSAGSAPGVAPCPHG